jgi:hypothetical protein
MTEKLAPVLPDRKRRGKAMKRRELLKVGKGLIEALPSDLVKRYGITVNSYLKIDVGEDGFTVKPVASQINVDDMAWTMQLIEEAKRKEAEKPTTDEEMIQGLKELGEYTAAQADKQGIKSEEDIMNIVYAFREKQQQRSQSGT